MIFGCLSSPSRVSWSQVQAHVQQLQCQPQALPGPSQAGHSGQQLHKPQDREGLLQAPAHAGPQPNPTTSQNAHHCKIPYKGTCSYHHFTSALSHGAAEYLPRDLWANSVRSQTQLLCPSRHSLGLGPASGSMQKNLTNYLSLENLSISECWLDKCHLTFAKRQQRVQTHVSMKKISLLPSSELRGS